MGKLIIVSNRLPVSIRIDESKVEYIPSTGGLATGLKSLSGQSDVRWIGWDGGLAADTGPELQDEIARELARRGLQGVAIDAAQFDGYYNHVANGAIWPLYHYQIERMPLQLHGWEDYVAVNQCFADHVTAAYQRGDAVWVHDYHLQLLPRLLRERIPDMRIGFFMHVPFPSSEVFRILPWRREILDGLLGADVIGFHTHAYARHFRSALLRLLGLDSYVDSVFESGREIKISAFPLGVDAQWMTEQAGPQDARLAASLDAVKADGRVKHIMLSIDRLDYTKGLPRRLLAVERLLENAPELRGSVVFVQVAPLSRHEVPAYETYRREVEGLVGRINGRFGMPGYQPIHYVSRAFTQAEVVAAFPHIDVMVVTPLRDGMNLVAKEFIAARGDLDGALVLSEFAGAADELGEAVQVNPYDITDAAAGLQVAIQMPAAERRERMKALRARVLQFDAANWVRRFTDLLWREPQKDKPVVYVKPRDIAGRFPAGQRKVLFLDYDGTLFPIVRIPQLAAPDKALLALLNRLAAHRDYELHVVSGRAPQTLSEWFGEMPLHLHAEHGALSRTAGTQEWIETCSTAVASDWKSLVRPVLADFVRNTPGSFVEEKTSSIAWHYRMSDPLHGERMANELRLHGRESFAHLGLELMTGKRLIEIRGVGSHKGRVITRVLEAKPADTFVCAIGDDITDEDMFEAMPAHGLTFCVGDHTTKAQMRLRDPADVRRLLELLANPGELAP